MAPSAIAAGKAATSTAATGGDMRERGDSVWTMAAARAPQPTAAAALPALITTAVRTLDGSMSPGKMESTAAMVRNQYAIAMS
jgi:hypothetical protein